MPIRVVLAEDHYLVREGVRGLLASLADIEVVAVCDDLDSLLAAVEAEHPDVVVTDIRMPGISGIEMLAYLRNCREPTPVILITAFGDEELHGEAARWGASAVLDKPFELDDLRRAVQGVAPHF